MLGRERRDMVGDFLAPSRIGLRGDIPAAETLGQSDNAERIDIQALICGRRCGGAGLRSIRTNSVEPPPMSNRMAPRPCGSSSGEQPSTASSASVSRSMTSI